MTRTLLKIKRNKLLALLDEMENTGGAAISCYFPACTTETEVRSSLDALALAPDDCDATIKTVLKSSSGAVLFWGDNYKYVILPPFPGIERLNVIGYDVEPLRLLLQRDLVVALMLVRLGMYAIGVFRGEELLSSKVGTGLVHGRHRQGGSSARRFERHREAQMRAFFTRVCTRAREQIEPYLGNLDYLYFGGERGTVTEFCKQCRFVQRLEGKTLPTLLNVREPKQASLLSAIDDAWSCRMLRWDGEQL